MVWYPRDFDKTRPHLGEPGVSLSVRIAQQNDMAIYWIYRLMPKDPYTYHWEFSHVQITPYGHSRLKKLLSRARKSLV